jgi:very-short-patch-repair endonuclease
LTDAGGTVDSGGPTCLRMPPVHNRPAQTPFRKALRHAPTGAEHALWSALRGRRLHGRRFRRQHGIGPYVVDFYCAEEGLVLELDGAVHADPARAASDAERQRSLEGLGLRVVRFENRAVWAHADAILGVITDAFRHPI